MKYTNCSTICDSIEGTQEIQMTVTTHYPTKVSTFDLDTSSKTLIPTHKRKDKRMCQNVNLKERNPIYCT